MSALATPTMSPAEVRAWRESLHADGVWLHCAGCREAFWLAADAYRWRLQGSRSGRLYCSHACAANDPVLQALKSASSGATIMERRTVPTLPRIPGACANGRGHGYVTSPLSRRLVCGDCGAVRWPDRAFVRDCEAAS